MNCEEFAEVYELYALGVLDGPEKEALEEHLGRNCETCMKEIKRAVENNSLVFRAVPKLDPPAHLRNRILAGFGLETRPFWLRALPWAVAASAARPAGPDNGLPARNCPRITPPPRWIFFPPPGTRQVSFGGNGPHGSILMQQQKGMLLVVVNLPSAPTGQMYETWIVPRAGDARPTGQLHSEKKW